jgi:hypothetical protein
LEHLKGSDATQLTIICTWLTEIYLNKLNQLRASNAPVWPLTRRHRSITVNNLVRVRTKPTRSSRKSSSSS